MDWVKTMHDQGLWLDRGLVGPERQVDDGPMSREMGRLRAGRE